ncbi:MAG: thioesterase family protein [Desulfatiglandaceae bacterium]
MSEKIHHETTIRIRYKDTDRMGVVYYGNYLTFFEVGRTELMRCLGIPNSALEARGYTLPVVDAAATYRGNVGYDEIITVRTTISGATRVRIRFDYQVLDESGRLLVTGHTVHACLDSSMKPARIPEDIRAAIESPIQEKPAADSGNRPPTD